MISSQNGPVGGKTHEATNANHTNSLNEANGAVASEGVNACDQLSSQLVGEEVLRLFATSIDWSGSIGGTRHAECHRLFIRAAGLNVDPLVAQVVAREFVENSGGRIVERDIVRQCQRAFDLVEHGGDSSAEIDPTRFCRDSNGALVPLPHLSEAFDREKLRDKVSCFPSEVTRDFLRQRSSSWPSGWRDFLRGLFGAGSRVRVFDNMHSRRSLDLSSLPPEGISRPEGVWFLCNPVDGKWHQTEEGKLSCRSKESITTFRHLVLECDHKGDGIEADWLRFLVLLPMPIRAIYTSGGKSVHALIGIDAITKPEWDEIVRPLKRHLAVYGADPQAMTAVRLTRLPFCTRESTGREQELLYFRPDADETPIAEILS